MNTPNDSLDGSPDPLEVQLLKALQQDPNLLAELEVRIRVAHPAMPADHVDPPRVPSVGRADSLPGEGSIPTPLWNVGVGSVLGTYKLIEKVGSGGMGTVYKAVHLDSRVPNVYCAIKVLKPETLIPHVDRKFRDEAEVLAKLGHQDHIVQLLHALVDPASGVPFLVMPLIDGSSLADHLVTNQRQPSPWPWVADVIRQVAHGLVAINDRLPSLVHGDLKPGNILLEHVPKSDRYPSGVRALIADFGLAIIPLAHPGTNSMTRLGTVSYFSPEYILNANSVKPRSDIFSLGVVAYELITGKHPFQTNPHDKPQRVMLRICSQQPDDIGTSNPDVPSSFTNLIRRMLSKSPLARIHANEIVEDLTQLLDTARGMGETVARPNPQEMPPHGLDSDPGEIFGRDAATAAADGVTLEAEVSALADVTAPRRSRLYWGPGGVGKSTFALKVAHHPIVVAAYGPRRYQIKLDGVTTAQALQGTVAERLGMTGPNRATNLDATLQDGLARLIILDTLDDPVEHDRNDVNKLLARWEQFPNLTLVHTARSSLMPAGTRIERVEVRPLPTDAIRSIVLNVAPHHHRDPGLTRVLALADGLPLAAELLGIAVCEYSTLSEFLVAWDASGVALLNTAAGANRSASVHNSVAFSLNHTRLKDSAPARRLLRLLADLSDGLFSNDLQDAFPELDAQAVPILRSVGGLARIGNDRLTMLAPIREELQRLLPRDESDWKAAIIYMSNTVERKSLSYRYNYDSKALSWFQTMQRSLEELLAEGLNGNIIETVKGVKGVARFGSVLGNDYRHLLGAAAEMATEGDTAVCKGMIADMLHQQGETEEALRIYREECLPAYERLGDVREKSVTMGQIADMLYQRGETEEALRIYREECLPAFERLGDVRDKAITMSKIADVLERRGETDETLRIHREECLPAFERLGDVRDKAITMSKIADILERRGETDETLRIYREECLPAFERLGDVRERAVTMGQIADVLYQQGETDETLRIRREECLPAFERLGDVRARAITMGQIADMLQRRGEIGEALRIYREECLPAFERLGDMRSKAITMGQIADVLYQQGETDEPLRIHREEELPVYERLGDLRSKAITVGQIADLLEQRGDTDEALRIRREEELPVYERLGDLRSKAITVGQIADLLEQRGETDEALRIYREECLPVYDQLGDVREKAVTRGKIADVLHQRGEADEALRIYREECLPAFERLGDVWAKTITMSKIADLLEQRGETDEALRIYREECLPAYERLIDMQRAALCRLEIAKILIARNPIGDRREPRLLLEQALTKSQYLKSSETLEIQSLLTEFVDD